MEFFLSFESNNNSLTFFCQGHKNNIQEKYLDCIILANKTSAIGISNQGIEKKSKIEKKEKTKH